MIINMVLEHCIHLLKINYFDHLLDISSKTLIFLKTFNSEFSYIEVLFTDQNSRPLEMENKINITIAIN